MESKYVPSLSPALYKIAKSDLREEAKIRDQALEEMRHWIQKSAYIKNCRTDANFLLRFLRYKKFHVPMAQETLVRYITMRQQHPQWFHNTSMSDPMVLDLINRGVAFALPERDKHGRRVIFTIGGNIDPQKHTAEHVMKAMMVCFESLLEDEENQILGFSYLLDESGVTRTHVTNLWHPSEVTKIWATTEKAMPMRHKTIQFMKLPTLVSAVFTFAKNLMPSKLQKRIVVYKSEEDMKKNLDVALLPAEYGGRIPMKDMIDMFKEEIRQRQDRLMALDNMHIDIPMMTTMAKTGESCGAALAKEVLTGKGIAGSFRKLEID